MPGWLILAIILLVASGVLAVVWHLTRRGDAKALAAHAAKKEANQYYDRSAPSGLAVWFGWSAVGVFALGLVCVLVSAYNPVGTKEIGVETSFGRTAGHLSNGPHLTKPWIKVIEMDGAIQTDTFGSVKTPGSNSYHACIDVRIGNQQTACASVSIQWRIVPASVDELYKDYRSFDHVRNALVTRKLQAALNEALDNYNPINSIIVASNGGHTLTLNDYAKRVARILDREIGFGSGFPRIHVLSVLLPLLTYDKQTQSRINQLQQQVAQTAVAKQEITTNKKKAEANAALAQSVSHSPNVLVSRCLDDLDLIVKNGNIPPPGFSCWPGGSTVGVITDTRK